jgi:hypothetical protein
MKLALGTEPRDDYFDIELSHAAHKLVTEVRPIEPGQQVLISVDTASDMRVVWATAGAVHAVDGVPTVEWYPTQPEPI